MEPTHVPVVIFLVGIVLLATVSSRVSSRRRELNAPLEWRLVHNYIFKRLKEPIEHHDQRASTRLHLDSISLIMQISVSLVVLAAGLYIILSENYVEEKKWGYGTVGAVMGYWLRR